MMQHKQYSIRGSSFIYNGQYQCEGHSVMFLVCDDDTVLVQETFISGTNVSTNERKEMLSTAIEFQNSLKKLGYDKIS